MIYLAVIVAAQLALIALLVIERRRDRELHIAQVDRMAQRIQAPELAIAEHAQAAVGEWAPPAVTMDDDQSHWEAKEDLANRLAEMEMRNGG